MGCHVLWFHIWGYTVCQKEVKYQKFSTENSQFLQLKKEKSAYNMGVFSKCANWFSNFGSRKKS